MGRREIFCSLLVLTLLLLRLPAPASAERRIALVIGNGAYEIDPLRNPVNDASDIAVTLWQLGFQVTLLRDATLRTILEAIDTFSRQLGQGGVGLFYFAGHGVQVGGEHYLFPVSAQVTREQDVLYEAVPVGRILGAMEDADNQINIIILDACRDNPFARQWRSGQRGLAVTQAIRGSLIAYATAPGGIAIDGSGRNGLYSAHLLKHLSTPGLSVEHLFQRVREGVVKDTRGKQTPWESSSLIGDFSFASQAAGTPPAVPVSPPVIGPDPEAIMWALADKSTDPVDVRAFLEAYPNGRFAPVAQLKLQQLQRLAAQRHTEEQQRQADQERQRRERAAAEAQQRAEAQRREEERKRLEESKRQREQQQQAANAPAAQPPSQMARLEPEGKLRARESVAVPTATISGRDHLSRDWSWIVPSFRIDLAPVSNKEFLEFVKSNPQWKKSRVSSALHDGDCLKHWKGDESINAEETDHPVHYVSYYAAEAYCKSFNKSLPWLNHYRAASKLEGRGSYTLFYVKYDVSYTRPDFNFVDTEWTTTGWSSSPDPGKRFAFQHGSLHNWVPGSINYAPERDKRYTGRSLGFRCIEYSQRPYKP
jgi:uncharacterized caspase-like protein